MSTIHVELLDTVVPADDLGLPEQDWCSLCSRDESEEPGVPSEIVVITLERASWPDPGNGTEPVYEVVHLACGHTIARLC